MLPLEKYRSWPVPHSAACCTALVQASFSVCARPNLRRRDLQRAIADAARSGAAAENNVSKTSGRDPVHLA